MRTCAAPTNARLNTPANASRSASRGIGIGAESRTMLASYACGPQLELAVLRLEARCRGAMGNWR